MSLKLYTDAHIAKRIAVQLRQRGVDVVRCQEVGMENATDEAHLEYATQEGRAMVSIDSDFKRLHSEWQANGRNHNGIFAVSRRLEGEHGIGTIVMQLFEYWQLIEFQAASVDDDIHNQIIYIP